MGTNRPIPSCSPITTAELDEFLDFYEGLHQQQQHYLLRELEEVTGNRDSMRRHFEQRATNPRCIFLICRLDNKIVGFCILNPEQLQRKRHVAYLVIAVHEAHRGKGIATQLLKEALRHAPKHEISKIEFGVATANCAAIALYEKLGFTREGCKVSSLKIGGELVDEEMWGLELK